MTKQTFRVSDMHCSACVLTLEGIEDALPGIQKIEASYRKQQLAVEFNEQKVSLAQIVAEAQARGYQLIAL